MPTGRVVGWVDALTDGGLRFEPDEVSVDQRGPASADAFPAREKGWDEHRRGVGGCTMEVVVEVERMRGGPLTRAATLTGALPPPIAAGIPRAPSS